MVSSVRGSGVVVVLTAMVMILVAKMGSGVACCSGVLIMMTRWYEMR